MIRNNQVPDFFEKKKHLVKDEVKKESEPEGQRDFENQ